MESGAASTSILCAISYGKGNANADALSRACGAGATGVSLEKGGEVSEIMVHPELIEGNGVTRDMKGCQTDESW